MRWRFPSLAALLATALVASAAGARSIPYLNHRVTDQANVIGSIDQGRLETKLYNYERSTGHQLAILVIDSLDGEVLEQYSLRTAQQWRLGDRHRDDGLLILLAMKEHKIRIEVGYGLEGAVPDATAARVINEIMVPQMRNNDVYRALDQGTDAVMRAARGDAIGTPRFSSTPAPRWSTWAVLGVIGVVVLGRMTRFIRAPLFACVGAVAGWMLFHSLMFACIGAAAGFFLGLIAPVFGSSSYRRRGWGSSNNWDNSSSWGSSSSSSWSSSSSSSSSGGGGSFGGGGASGSW